MEPQSEPFELKNEHQASENNEIVSSSLLFSGEFWFCDACGGDSESGCLMSDPDDCVRN